MRAACERLRGCYLSLVTWLMSRAPPGQRRVGPGSCSGRVTGRVRDGKSAIISSKPHFALACSLVLARDREESETLKGGRHTHTARLNDLLGLKSRI